MVEGGLKENTDAKKETWDPVCTWVDVTSVLTEMDLVKNNMVIYFLLLL